MGCPRPGYYLSRRAPGTPLLIFIGNTTAFNAFIALATVGINLSYSLPVFLYLVYGRRHYQSRKRAIQFGKIRALSQLPRCCVDFVFDSVPLVSKLSACHTGIPEMYLRLIFRKT